MYEFLNKIKAVIKILISVMISILISFPIIVTVVLIVTQGVIGLLLGIVIIILAIIIGSILGAKWAKKNVSNHLDAKSIAIWSAILFFIIHIFISVTGNLLLFALAAEKRSLLPQFIQIIIPTFTIYIVSRRVLSRGLDKI